LSQPNRSNRLKPGGQKLGGYRGYDLTEEQRAKGQGLGESCAGAGDQYHPEGFKRVADG